MTRRTVLAAAAALVAPAGAATLAATLAAPEREAMVRVPGGRVYVRVNGNLAGPRPPIVLVHGGPGSSHWAFLNALALADDRAVILYDQLDCGRSDTPGDPTNWVIPRFVAELEAVRAALGVTRWHVLGASWGGTVALEYAARQPVELAGLVLQSPLVSTAAWLADARALKDAMPAEIRARLDACDVPGAVPQAECDAATDAFYARHVRRVEPSPAVAAYKAALPRSFSSELYNYMWGRAEFTSTGTLRDYDGRPLLQRLGGERTLFVAGEHDEARPATVQGFAAALPGGAGFAEIPQAAHSIFNDNPAGFFSVLQPWLAARD